MRADVVGERAGLVVAASQWGLLEGKAPVDWTHTGGHHGASAGLSPLTLGACPKPGAVWGTGPQALPMVSPWGKVVHF